MLPVLRTVQVVADAVVIVDVVDRPDVVLVDEITNKVAVDNHQTEDDTKFILALRVHKLSCTKLTRMHQYLSGCTLTPYVNFKLHTSTCTFSALIFFALSF